MIELIDLDQTLREYLIFVFGSNLAGRHGKGAAKTAKQQYGAQYGIGIGRTGNAYAIPTKGFHLEVLALDVIQFHVEVFIQYAREHSGLPFQLTRIGCGLAGYKDYQIAPMFKGVPGNVIVPEEWKSFL